MKGESPIEAAKREIFEEVGIKPSKIKVLGKIKDWVKYENTKRARKEKL
jgi:8-oxo-dGTP pyrophosphatase MutT (NUDIX family)